MTDTRSYAAMFRRARKSAEYWTEVSILGFTEGLRRQMGSLKQTDLAKRMDVSESYVSQILKGDENFTIQQMNKIAHHLGAAVHIHVARRDQVVNWTEQSTLEATQTVSQGDSFTTDPISFPPIGRVVEATSQASLTGA